MSYSMSYFNFIVWTSVFDNKFLLKLTELSNMFLNVLDFLKEKKMQSFLKIFTPLLLRVHQQCWSLSLLPVLSWIPVSGSKISSGLYIWILQPLRKGQWFTELPFEFSNEKYVKNILVL